MTLSVLLNVVEPRVYGPVPPEAVSVTVDVPPLQRISVAVAVRVGLSMVKVWLQVVLADIPPLVTVMVTSRVNDPLGPATTFTVWPVVDPGMVALPETVHAKVGLAPSVSAV